MHHRHVPTVLLLAGALAAAGCALGPHRASYEVVLSRVDRPAEPDTALAVAAVDTAGLRFEDGRVRIAWEPVASGFRCDLLNKSEGELWVDWENAVLVDARGYSHTVVPGGAAGLEQGVARPPVRVLGGARLAETVVPTENVFWVEESGWRERPLFPQRARGDFAAFRRRVTELQGARMRILLPLVFGEEVREYVFAFDVRSAEARPGEAPGDADTANPR